MSQAVVQNHNITTINGGEFSVGENAQYVIHNHPCNANLDKGELTITDGSFKGVIRYDAVDSYGFVKLSGGAYNTKPEAAWLVNDKMVKEENGMFSVVDFKADNVNEDVKPEAPKVDVSDIPDDLQDTVTETAETLKSDDLVTEAGKVEITPEKKEEAIKALGDKAQGEEVTVVVTPYFNVTAKAAVTDGTTLQQMTFDIEPMYVLKATTNPNDMTDANTVQIGEAEKMEVTEAITLTTKLPDGFVPQVVKHVKK